MALNWGDDVIRMEFPTDRQVSTTDEKAQPTASAVLDAAMLAVDAADLLADRPELAADASALRSIYADLGITLPDAAIAEAQAGLADGRFHFAPPSGGFDLMLARLYVARGRWLPGAIAVVLALVIGVGGYFLVYQPYAEGQAERARTELTEAVPAALDALYETIYEETKVQAAAARAGTLRDAGKQAAAKGDRMAALQAVDDLTALRDLLRLDYRLTVADRPGVKWGFWAFPDDFSDETNYYLVVDSRTADGTPLSIPVATGSGPRTESVSTFALRVPEEVYRAVETDKNDNGRIDRPFVGFKQFGYIDPTYAVDVLGGTLTRW